ncbi:hypothetical protein PAAG_08623 [Paracoccidioides lutzii Pb01]|uniref:tRNA-splicing endonuclease subunit Sen15 domain-containing protein n=1 Tax=Paracoccidioides lutzii (strain ATCC MYA-826 / Pb01) TaxID=502779 RepID=C1HCY2_PARBA|nr:hypothetical protein PAAG_08623 [Paracoccidioides lutzii Pb01]EEH39354.1 hypothetical protein PAAG_08623 [Paracoccidioides lutzii Pb01]
MPPGTVTPPFPSALSTLTHPTSQNPISSLTTQIQHNLQYQHRWTSLRIHSPHTLSPSQNITLISGLPPQTLYTHQDEQAYMLEHGINPDDVPTEREWVIPTAQGQAWSLRQLAECFDVIPLPDSKHAEGVENVVGMTVEKGGDSRSNGISEVKSGEGKGMKTEKKSKEEIFAEYQRRKRGKEWGGKRALLAMVDRGKGGDGTVVYYVVLEGSVKPRQN